MSDFMEMDVNVSETQNFEDSSLMIRADVRAAVGVRITREELQDAGDLVAAASLVEHLKRQLTAMLVANPRAFRIYPGMYTEYVSVDQLLVKESAPKPNDP